MCRGVPGRAGAVPGRAGACWGVIIDKRRDHKRLAEERRRRRRCAAPKKKPGRRGRASGCEPDRAPVFFGGRRGGVVVCVPPLGVYDHAFCL